MISFKCSNCGGEVSVNSKGELACPYCGTKVHMSDAEFADYKQFRSNMLDYLRVLADEKADEADDNFVWSFHNSQSFHTADDRDITVDYLFNTNIDGVECYVAKESVIYVFTKAQINMLDRMVAGVKSLEYPSAALKDLSRSFPTIVANIELVDGDRFVAVSKPKNAYPLFAFGSIKPDHVAWIVSRLENICCVFEYNDIVHNGINIDTVFINPRTHEAFLYGGWWNWNDKSGKKDLTDLHAIRTVANKILGEYRNSIPKQFDSFIKGKPASDAYTDFGMWDEVIEKGFGGHKFVKFS